MARHDNDEEQLARWSKQAVVPTTPQERIRALVNSPLGAGAWANPLRLGPFTIHDYWETRQAKDLIYSRNWPSGALTIAQFMMDTGLQAHEIDLAIRTEGAHSDTGITTLLQLHRQLSIAHGRLPDYRDALGCMTTVFEATTHRALGGSTLSAALRSNMQTPYQWEIALQALVQYDNSPQAQNTYLARIDDALAPPKPKAAGALPERGLRRRLEQDDQDPYVYGWDGTGSIMVQTLPQADNAALAQFLHSKHDIHGLGAMVVQGRLDFSQFLDLAANPASTPLPTRADQYRNVPTPEAFRKKHVVTILGKLATMLAPERLSEQVNAALVKDPTISDKLQAMVALDPTEQGIGPWWAWNLCLHKIGAIDPAQPTPQFQQQLTALEAALPSLQPNSDMFARLTPEQFDGAFEAFANTTPTLANTALLLLLKNIPFGKPTEAWEKVKNMQLSWLPKADCARAITPAFVAKNDSFAQLRLPFVAMVLPLLSPLDQARLAPMVAYGVGVNTVASLSPSTLRSMWKERNPADFKATIPKQYTNDTYILYALTRKDADDLLATLSAMDVRRNVSTYQEYVENWTRQAFDVPPIIEEIGPTENLFGV